MYDALELPDKVDYLKDYGNNERGFIENLYQIFYADFVFTNPKCDETLVTISHKKMDGDEKPAIFWHLITRDNTEKSKRELNISRAERLPWIKPLIEMVPRSFIVYWKYLEGNGRIRHYIWARKNEFIVVLEELKTSLRLITAFRVDEKWKERDLLRKYDKRVS